MHLLFPQRLQPNTALTDCQTTFQQRCHHGLYMLARLHNKPSTGPMLISMQKSFYAIQPRAIVLCNDVVRYPAAPRHCLILARHASHEDPTFTAARAGPYQQEQRHMLLGSISQHKEAARQEQIRKNRQERSHKWSCKPGNHHKHR
jgi:hypothetical protein